MKRIKTTVQESTRIRFRLVILGTLAAALTLLAAGPEGTSLLEMHEDKCADAKDAAQKYLDTYETIRKMELDEQSHFVDAVCRSDEEERSSVLQEAGRRVESMVHSNIDQSKELKEAADTALKAAIESEDCKEKDDLVDLQKRCQVVSDRIDRMMVRISASSNPVFDAFKDFGQKIHKIYQDKNSRVENANETYGNAEVTLKDIARRVDFMDPEGCQVIELKPKANSSARNDGFDDGKKARDWLNDAKNLPEFIAKYPKYSHCTKFVTRVDCYTFCPEVQEDCPFGNTVSQRNQQLPGKDRSNVTSTLRMLRQRPPERGCV
jgi:hypothetical protein